MDSKFKQFFVDNRKKFSVAAAMLLSFVFGFSIALVRAAPSSPSPYANSTPVSINDQTLAGDSADSGDAAVATPTPTPKPKTAAAVPVGAKVDPTCIVKAKKKTTGTSLYYVAGDISYNRVKPTDCFQTEADAQAAGFTKAGG